MCGHDLQVARVQLTVESCVDDPTVCQKYGRDGLALHFLLTKSLLGHNPILCSGACLCMYIWAWYFKHF